MYRSQNGFSSIFLIIIAFVLVSAGAYYLGTQNTPTPRTTTEVETLNNVYSSWDTYTNAEHSFSFQYPPDIFVYKGVETPTAQYFANQNAGSPLEMDSNGVWLNMSFQQTRGTLLEFYNDILDLSPDQTIDSASVEKYKNISYGGTTIALYHQGIPESTPTEIAYCNVALWIDSANIVYKLDYCAFSDDILSENKDIFDQIVASIKIN